MLLPFGPWPGADVQLRCAQACWRGAEAGHGHLREREVTVVGFNRKGRCNVYTHPERITGEGTGE